ncbi:MAG: hypothetical protein JW888_18745 [Pirellulales bacterium]|nr:hypothetical protein [Pirellulales bacterium]
MVSAPECHLFSEAGVGDQPGRWRVVLRHSDGTAPLEVGDVEPDITGERLELLSVVRGLEALERPSRVVLMTASVYVREGIRYGLEEWRCNEWQWESFGQLVPVKNRDLWQRVDRALRFHQVECRTWRIDSAHARVPSPHAKADTQRATLDEQDGTERLLGIKPRLRRLIDESRRRISLCRKELERVACL